MELQHIISILGVIVLIFRIWLTEFKLAEELQFRRHYLSRIVNYYLIIGLIFNFHNPIFNAIIIVCFPVMIITSIWDIYFFRQLKNRVYFTKNHGWLILERSTLHPPMLIAGLYLFFNLPEYLPSSLFPFIWGVLLVFIPFFILDERWASKYNYPQAIIMISMMTISTGILMIIGVWILPSLP
jgi:hypothetical protein